MQIYNVFFVGSPLQLLCADEACHEFAIEPKNRILIVYQYGDNAVELFQTVSQWNREDWPQTYFLPNIQKLRFLYVFGFLKKRIKPLQDQVKRVFIADERLLFHHFINSVNTAEVWLVDDGVATQSIAVERKARKDSFRLKNLVLSILGIRGQPVRLLNYFTCFDVVTKADERVIKNDFTLLRSRIKNTEVVQGRLILLGSATVEHDLVSQEHYLSYLQAIASDDRYTSITYYPHRREEQYTLDKLDFIDKITIKRASIPIEIGLSHLDERPEYIGSFYSSALVTLPKIYGDDYTYIAYVIPEKDLNEVVWKQSVLAAYKLYQNKEIKCIEL